MVEGRVTAYPVIGAVGESEVGVTRRRARSRCAPTGVGKAGGGREGREGEGDDDKLSRRKIASGDNCPSLAVVAVVAAQEGLPRRVGKGTRTGGGKS